MEIIIYIVPGTKLICWHIVDETTQYKMILDMTSYAWNDIISANIVENSVQFASETKEIKMKIKITEREHITLMGVSDEIKI